MRAGAAALLCALCCGLARGSEDIVVGCGGFVKSDVEINYSLIEVGAAASPLPSGGSWGPVPRAVSGCAARARPGPAVGRRSRALLSAAVPSETGPFAGSSESSLGINLVAVTLGTPECKSAWLEDAWFQPCSRLLTGLPVFFVSFRLSYIQNMVL